MHCRACLHFPGLRSAVRFLFFARKNGISHAVVKAACRGLDTDVYRSQIYCFKLVWSTCSFVRSSPPYLDDSVWVLIFRKMCEIRVKFHRNTRTGCSCELTSVLLQPVPSHNKDCVQRAVQHYKGADDLMVKLSLLVASTLCIHHHLLAVNQRGNPVFKAL